MRPETKRENIINMCYKKEKMIEDNLDNFYSKGLWINNLYQQLFF